MAAAFAQRGTPTQLFAKFPDLPVEIRCLIWAKASPSRPRVIQIAYEAEKEIWRACVDSCGGLPLIIPVCREARQEALKPYTRLLNTWIDLEEDTIFISDPMFNIRKPRSNFMDSPYLSSIQRIAFTEDVYFGMKLLYESFPLLVDQQAAIIRKMQRLSHFILVLMEDGAGFDSDSEEAEFEYFDDGSPASGIDQEEGAEEEEQDNDVDQGSDHDENHDEQDIHSAGPEHEYTGSDVVQEEDAIQDESINDEIADEEQWLSVQETDAMERLCKGYFRHVGDIHFRSAMHSPDYWDSWYSYLEQINSDFDEQLLEDPEWTRPMVAIVEIKYGLYSTGQSPPIDFSFAPLPDEESSSGTNSEMI